MSCPLSHNHLHQTQNAGCLVQQPNPSSKINSKPGRRLEHEYLSGYDAYFPALETRPLKLCISGEIDILIRITAHGIGS